MKDVNYLGSPYSHKDWLVKDLRAEAVADVAGKLMAEGTYVFSPIAHAHSFEHHIENWKWEDFKPYDNQFLTACGGMYVLMLDGWKESVGLTWEIKRAAELKKDITYLPEECVSENILEDLKSYEG